MKRLPCLLALVLILITGCGEQNSPQPLEPYPGTTVESTPASALTPAVESAAPDIPSPEPTPEPVSAKLQFAGDILLHSGPVKYAKTGENTYDFKSYFEAVKPLLDGDLSICNMESPVDALGGNKELSSYPMFNVPYEILEALKYAGFDHLLTANNHAFDKKAAGLEATLDNIARAGLESTGTYATREAFETPTVLDVNGIKVGIIAYTDSYNGLESIVPSERLPYLMRKFDSGSLNDLPRMLEDIESARSAGAELVVFALHWGAEYVDNPTQRQRDIALALLEGGADIIFGGHSHCVQPVEWVEVERGGETVRRLIMYSLGNFFADQIAMEPPVAKTQYGMLVNVMVTEHPDGGITLDSCTAVPTLSYRERGGRPPDGYHYQVLPLESVEGDTVPAFMPGDDAWQWGLQAYAHVAKIIGEEFLE